MKSALKYVAYAIGIASTGYLLFMALFSSYLHGSARETWKAMHAKPFECPPGAEVTYRAWAENGRMRYCEKLKDGPWEAWMSGYKWVEGAYANGKKHGKWVWFNKDGSVKETSFYEEGNVVSAEK